MGITKNISEISERIGNGTADFLDLVAEEIRDFSCSLWQAFPDQITQNKNLGASFSRGFMNRLCADKPLPPPPAVSFNGGQCEGVSYRVTTNNRVYNTSNCSLVINNDANTTVLGPVEGTVFVVDTPSFGTSSCNGLNNAPVDLGRWVLKSASPDINIIVGAFKDQLDLANPPLSSCTITNITRIDGQPDTCGDPPATYPTTEPTVNDYTTNITYNTEDGGNLTIPLVYAPIDVNFPLNFNFGDINVTIDLGGINFNFGENNPDGTPVPLPDGQEHPLPPPTDDDNRSFKPIPLPPPNLDDYDEDIKLEEDPKEEDVDDTLRFVKITLTSIPTNAKTQFGDGAPNVIYCGWFEFQAEGYNFNGRPIHFSQ